MQAPSNTRKRRREGSSELANPLHNKRRNGDLSNGHGMTSDEAPLSDAESSDYDIVFIKEVLASSRDKANSTSIPSISSSSTRGAGAYTPLPAHNPHVSGVHLPRPHVYATASSTSTLRLRSSSSATIVAPSSITETTTLLPKLEQSSKSHLLHKRQLSEVWVEIADPTKSKPGGNSLRSDGTKDSVSKTGNVSKPVPLDPPATHADVEVIDVDALDSDSEIEFVRRPPPTNILRAPEVRGSASHKQKQLPVGDPIDIIDLDSDSERMPDNIPIVETIEKKTSIFTFSGRFMQQTMDQIEARRETQSQYLHAKDSQPESGRSRFTSSLRQASSSKLINYSRPEPSHGRLIPPPRPSAQASSSKVINYSRPEPGRGRLIPPPRPSAQASSSKIINYSRPEPGRGRLIPPPRPSAQAPSSKLINYSNYKPIAFSTKMSSLEHVEAWLSGAKPAQADPNKSLPPLHTAGEPEAQPEVDVGVASLSIKPRTDPQIRKKKKRAVPWLHDEVWVEVPPLVRRRDILKKRKQIEDRWNVAAGGAAPITIVNDVDNEVAPPVGDDFQYVEAGYIYAEGTPEKPHPRSLVGCDCKRCDDPLECQCQNESDTREEYAYDQHGYFRNNITRGQYVLECNAACECAQTCLNRVVQRPRDVPIEIFKTEKRGWGARSTGDILLGKVLGIYSGLLIPRKVADEDGRPLAYCFDLDGKERWGEDAESNDDDDTVSSKSDTVTDIDNLYSVDALRHGNWSRFINHSCEPNLFVYNVVYDNFPNTLTPYLAFVAKVDIPAGTEFSFDYDPSTSDIVPAVKVEKRVNEYGIEEEVEVTEMIEMEIPEGAYACHCGARLCRGWVRTPI